MKTEIPKQQIETSKNLDLHKEFDSRLEPMSETKGTGKDSLDSRIDLTKDVGLETRKSDAFTQDVEDVGEKGKISTLDSRIEKGKEEAESRDNKDIGSNYNEINISRNDVHESDSVEKDSLNERISDYIDNPKGLEKLFQENPDKQALWSEKLDTVNSTDSSPLQIRSAESTLKGQLLETAVKQVLSEKGFDVQPSQKKIKGELGDIKPDVVASNNSDHSIQVFGYSINSGERISIECKCGGKEYLTSELKGGHIQKQLSGPEKAKVLLTTSDIKDVPDNLGEKICDQCDARLVSLDTSAADVGKAVKEMADNEYI